MLRIKKTHVCPDRGRLPNSTPEHPRYLAVDLRQQSIEVVAVSVVPVESAVAVASCRARDFHIFGVISVVHRGLSMALLEGDRYFSTLAYGRGLFRSLRRRLSTLVATPLRSFFYLRILKRYNYYDYTIVIATGGN